jgi:hypothetical protein
MMTGVEAEMTDTDYRVTEDGVIRATEADSERVAEDSDINLYRLWIHEEGMDEIDGLSMQPIQSYFETADISLPVIAQDNHALSVVYLEPDFVQVGDMTVQVMGRANARSPEVNGIPMTFVENPQTPQEQVVFLKTQRRELRFRFESNTLGGNYQMGLILAHLQEGDGTTLG